MKKQQKQLKTYTVKYYFDGNGEAQIKAKSKKDAENKFFEGITEKEKEWGENFDIRSIELNSVVKNK